MVTKGLIANRRGSAGPDSTGRTHLCGVETPLTMLCARAARSPTGAAELLPRVTW